MKHDIGKRIFPKSVVIVENRDISRRNVPIDPKATFVLFVPRSINMKCDTVLSIGYVSIAVFPVTSIASALYQEGVNPHDKFVLCAVDPAILDFNVNDPQPTFPELIRRFVWFVDKGDISCAKN